MEIHFYFDLLSYILAFFVKYKYFNNKTSIKKDISIEYYSILVIGVVLGSVLIGSLNTFYSIERNITLGKSILGAILGGIISIELFKKFYKIKGSTGAYFVPSLALGIFIGRWGCFFAGIEDYTYGIQTNSIIGVDFGDGILRHPVQLYESFSMGVFFIFSIYLYRKNRVLFEEKIFYYFVVFYNTQRFFWEFLKPYKEILFNLNIFQLVNITLIIYGIYFLRVKVRENGYAK